MYNYSARRKQGLGSLRPGYFLGGYLGNVLLGNALNWGIGKATSKMFGTQETAEEKLNKQMAKFIYGYGNEKDDDTSKGFTSTPSAKSRIGGGILNALATMILGPIMGPIAMTIGRGLKNRYTGGDGDSGPGPKGLGPKTDWYTGSDEEDKDEENRITTPTTSVPTHIGPTGHDIHGDGNSGTTTTTTTSVPSHIGPSNGDSGGGSDGWSGGAETRDSSGWESSPFFKGGRVSYSKGGLASLWQR